MPGTDCGSRLTVSRPNAATGQGNGDTLQASQQATPNGTARTAGLTRGASAASAAAAASPISNRSAPAVPTAGTSSRLNANAPARAPIVLAAYTPPTSRPGSWPRDATAASASGKLAPHRQAGGKTAHRHRTKSSWNVYQGLGESSGRIGQYGSEFEIMNAVQAIAATSSHWQTPSANRADAARRVRNAPRPPPIPRPIRKTARINENVYTVPPSINDSNRVQTTSAPRADMPDRPIAR